MARGFEMIHLLAFALLASQNGAPQRSLPALRQLYVQECARCHGLDGSASSPEGVRLKGLDFTSAAEMKGRTETAMAGTIAGGLFFGLRMPAFRKLLSEAESRTLIREILAKAEKGKPIDAGAGPGR